MALIRWEPAAELNTIQTEMNRLFNSLFDTPARPTTGTVGRRWIPAMDLVEEGDRYVLRADLPGLSEKDVNIELESDVLTISGERKVEHSEEKGGYRRIERSYGSFSRSLTLPEGIDPEAVEAKFDRGVLEVRIPKPEQIKPRKVTIAVGAGAGNEGHEVLEGTATSTDSTAPSETPESRVAAGVA
jgi:HSP20 family protein